MDQLTQVEEEVYKAWEASNQALDSGDLSKIQTHEVRKDQAKLAKIASRLEFVETDTKP